MSTQSTHPHYVSRMLALSKEQANMLPSRRSVDCLSQEQSHRTQMPKALVGNLGDGWHDPSGFKFVGTWRRLFKRCLQGRCDRESFTRNLTQITKEIGLPFLSLTRQPCHSNSSLSSFWT